jgi:hypothetical protein
MCTVNLAVMERQGIDFFFFADRSSFIQLFEVWILGIPHHRGSENISAKDRFPLFPISRNNALCTFMQ